MGRINQLKIENNTYYFYDDIINIKNFQSNLIKIDKKPDIYFIYFKIFIILAILLLKNLITLVIIKIFTV